MRKIVLGVFLGLLAGLLLGKANAVDTPVQPEEVAAAYFVAIQASDLDAAGRLFARESSIFETGGVEGNWQHYRDHHLGPEIDAIASFAIDPLMSLRQHQGKGRPLLSNKKTASRGTDRTGEHP
jgi:hypothetical protein